MKVGVYMKKDSVPALTRGLNLLELISHLQPVGFNKLQQETELNTSSLNRLLKNLTENGYICKNRDNKYELALKLFTLTHQNSLWQSLSHNIHNIIEDVSKQFQVTVLFVIYMNNGNYVFDKVVCDKNVAMRNIGNLSDDYADNPWGMLRLFYMDNEERETYLSKLNDKQSNIYKLSADFIKHNGYCDDKNMLYDYMRRIAVPVFSNDSKLIASVAIGSFVNLIDDDKILSIAALVKEKIKLLLL